MQVGGPGADWGTGFKTALAEPAVASVVAQLVAAKDERVLDYAMYATSEIPFDAQIGMLRGQLRGIALLAVNAIEPIASGWRASLGTQDLGFRKGAIVQKLVESLLTSRPGGMSVYPETRLILSIGQSTSGMDVLAVPPTGAWEAHECKATYGLSFQQEKELTWMAAAEGSSLIVCVTSAASSTALRSHIAAITNGHLLHYVGAERIFTLDMLPPVDQVAAPSPP
jgi:hypothetical protein